VAGVKKEFGNRLLPAMSQLSALANPVVPQIDSAVLDYFLIEAVNTLRLSAAVATQRQKELEEEMAKANLLQQPQAREAQQDAAEEALKTRLEGLGSRVGASLVER
jgi:trafficking protein particle complex subunit 6